MIKPNMTVQERKKFAQCIITIAESKPQISIEAMDALNELCNMFHGLAHDNNFSIDLGDYIGELHDLARNKKPDNGCRKWLRKNIMDDIEHADEFDE